MAHPNEELVRRGYAAFAEGDMETLRELFDPEIVWHFPGRSVLAGDHRGPDAVLGVFGRTMELTAGTFRVEVHDVVADDQHTIGLHLATGEREGRTLEDREVLVFHLRDGKVVEVWQYIENQYTYDEFFS
jgi:ketosteroid isomerase-like protein